MEPTTQQALVDIIEALKSSIETVGTVARDQLPALVQDYLAWGLVDALSGIIVSVAVLAMSLVVGQRIVRHAATCRDQECLLDGGFVLGRIVVPSAGLAIFVGLMATAVPQLLQVLFAPRVYLLETLAHIIK